MKIKSIWIEMEHWTSEERNPIDNNTDVIVTLEDGTELAATFFSYRNISTLTEKNRLTGECLSGKYFWASDMVLVDEVSRECIEDVVRYLIEEEPEEFRSIFS